MENQLVCGRPTKVVEGGTPKDGDILVFSASSGKWYPLSLGDMAVDAEGITATTLLTALEELASRVAALEP